MSRNRREILDELGVVGRKHSTAVVLFHHAIAERMGLNPTDHKCADVLFQRGSMTAGQLAEITGLTSGTITAVLDRLETAGLIKRVADPHDRRKVLLEPLLDRVPEGALLFAEFLAASDQLLDRYNDEQLAVILDYLTATIQLYEEQAVNLRNLKVKKKPHK